MEVSQCAKAAAGEYFIAGFHHLRCDQSALVIKPGNPTIYVCKCTEYIYVCVLAVELVCLSGEEPTESVLKGDWTHLMFVMFNLNNLSQLSVK